MERAVTTDRTLGFTLIELLVAVAILSVLSVGATLAVGRGASEEQTDQARFQQQFERLRQLAVTGQQVRGLKVDARGMFSASYGSSGWKIAEARQRWAGKVILSVLPSAITGSTSDPQILFLPSGQTTAFSISFGQARCETDGWEGMTCRG